MAARLVWSRWSFNVFEMNLTLVTILKFILIRTVFSEKPLSVDNISDVDKKDAEAKFSMFLENNSIEDLPVHSTNRKQSSCSEGVEEETTLYKFDFKDLHDEMTSLLVPVVSYIIDSITLWWNVIKRYIIHYFWVSLLQVGIKKPSLTQNWGQTVIFCTSSLR